MDERHHYYDRQITCPFARNRRSEWRTGRGAVAYSHLTRFVQPALVDGAVGLVFAPRGKLSRVLSFTIVNGKIVQVEIIADRERRKQLDVSVLTE